jgi:hypothetical protein
MKQKARIVVLNVLLLVMFFPLGAKNKSIPCQWSGIERIIAVGDIHGDLGQFTKILKGTGLTDENLRWIGGNTHLVQLGDVMDRGDDAKKIFDLIKRLEGEAKAAGGRVHMLLGNHEEVNITGSAFQYAGYMTIGQFVSFLDPAERKKLEKAFRLERGETQFKNTALPLSLEDPDVAAFWMEKMNDANFQPKYQNAFYKNYGGWLLQHNAIIKINDVVFTHGGVAEKHAGADMAKMNKQIWEEMKIVRSIVVDGKPTRGFYPKFVYQEDSPLWYRDLATRPEEDVDRILKALDACCIVIGHTTYRGPITSKEDLSRFDNRVWTIDTGMSARYGGIPTALIYESGEFSLWGINHEK